MANYEKEIKEAVGVLDYLDRKIDYNEEPEAAKWLSSGFFYYKEYFRLNKNPEFKFDQKVENYDSFQKNVEKPVFNKIIQFYISLQNLPDEVYRNVPIRFLGEPELVSDGRVKIKIHFNEIFVRGLLSDIPSYLELDTGSISNIDDVLKVGDIKTPDNIKVITSENEIIVSLTDLQEKETPTTVSTTDEKISEEEVADTKELTEQANLEEESIKPKELNVGDAGSVPPEIESLVGEYKKNLNRLNEQEIKDNHQKSVAEQVKIAIEHSNRRELILANRREREAKGEKFQDPDQVIVSYGSPKDNTKEDALQLSFNAIERTATLYSGFKTLPKNIQKQIVFQAVELNTIGIFDLDAAIQTASYQLGIKGITSPFVSSIFEEIDHEDNFLKETESKLHQNEKSIDFLKSKNTLTESERQSLIKLIKENGDLSTNLGKIPTNFNSFLLSNEDKFKEYSKIIDHKDADPKDVLDLKENTLDANKKILSIQKNLLLNGIQPKTFTDLDKINGLAEAIQKDLKVLNKNATYEGSYSAAVVGMAPGGSGEALVILNFSKGLTGETLRKAEAFALANPKSATAIFLRNNTKTVEIARSYIRKIENSPLGKEILPAIGKANFIISAVTNPVGALKSWAGKKAGEQLAIRISEKIGNEVLKNAANTLLTQGMKGGVKKLASEAATKMAAKVATWAAVKLGISLSAESLNAIMPGLGVIVDIVIQAIIWVAEKTIGQVKKNLDSLWREMGWGEEFRTRDIIVPVVAVVATATTFVIAKGFIIKKATQIAAISAVKILLSAGGFILAYVMFAYLVAPILSTLVQFDSLEKVEYPSATSNEPAIPGCPSRWPVTGSFRITQGPGGKYSHYSSGYDQSVDIAAPSGTTVFSTSDGIVSFAAVSGPYLNTNVVFVDSKLPDGKSFQVIYAHLSFMKVHKNDKVKVGDIIGSSGTAGSGAHLHYEYKGIKYNQCPAGNLKLAENCDSHSVPGAGFRCVPDVGTFLYTNGGAGIVGH